MNARRTKTVLLNEFAEPPLFAVEPAVGPKSCRNSIEPPYRRPFVAIASTPVYRRINPTVPTFATFCGATVGVALNTSRLENSDAAPNNTRPLMCTTTLPGVGLRTPFGCTSAALLFELFAAWTGNGVVATPSVKVGGMGVGTL